MFLTKLVNVLLKYEGCVNYINHPDLVKFKDEIDVIISNLHTIHQTLPDVLVGKVSSFLTTNEFVNLTRSCRSFYERHAAILKYSNCNLQIFKECRLLQFARNLTTDEASLMTLDSLQHLKGLSLIGDIGDHDLSECHDMHSLSFLGCISENMVVMPPNLTHLALKTYCNLDVDWSILHTLSLTQSMFVEVSRHLKMLTNLTIEMDCHKCDDYPMLDEMFPRTLKSLEFNVTGNVMRKIHPFHHDWFIHVCAQTSATDLSITYPVKNCCVLGVDVLANFILSIDNSQMNNVTNLYMINMPQVCYRNHGHNHHHNRTVNVIDDFPWPPPHVLGTIVDMVFIGAEKCLNYYGGVSCGHNATMYAPS